MNALKGIQLLLLCLLFVGCKNDNSKKGVSNVFNFKAYISNTSSGELSKATSINITLAKEVSAWIPNEEIAKTFLSISPKVEGTIVALNSRTIEFRPTENLKGNTEYTVSVVLAKIFPNVPKDL